MGRISKNLITMTEKEFFKELLGSRRAFLISMQQNYSSYINTYQMEQEIEEYKSKGFKITYTRRGNTIMYHIGDSKIGFNKNNDYKK